MEHVRNTNKMINFENAYNGGTYKGVVVLNGVTFQEIIPALSQSQKNTMELHQLLQIDEPTVDTTREAFADMVSFSGIHALCRVDEIYLFKTLCFFGLFISRTKLMC